MLNFLKLRSKLDNLNSFLDSLIWYVNMKKIDMKQKNLKDYMGEKNNAK